MDETIREMLQMQAVEEKGEEASLYFYFQQHVEAWFKGLSDTVGCFSESEDIEESSLLLINGKSSNYQIPIVSSDSSTLEIMDDKHPEIFKDVMQEIVSDKWEVPNNPVQMQAHLLAGVRFYATILTTVKEKDFEQVFPLVLKVDRRMGDLCSMTLLKAATANDRISRVRHKKGTGIGKDSQKKGKYVDYEEAFLEITGDDLNEITSVAKIIFEIRKKMPDGKEVTDNPIRNWLTIVNGVMPKVPTDKKEEYVPKFQSQVRELRKKLKKKRRK